MRYAWTPKFQLSGPTVLSYTVIQHSLTHQPQEQSIAGRIENTTEQGETRGRTIDTAPATIAETRQNRTHH